MSTPFGRPASPGSRRIIHPGRTSAGSLFTPTYYDVSSSRTTRDPIVVPRSSAERTDIPRVIPVRQRSPPRRTRDDDFLVRPRRVSMDPGEPGSRRPLSTLISQSPNHAARPVIIKESDRSSSPSSKPSSKPIGVQLEASYIIPASSRPSNGRGAQLESSYLIPASSSSGRHHNRHSSLTSGEQLRAMDRSLRERVYPAVSRASSVRQPARDNRDYAFESTDPRREFEREPTSMPRTRDRGDGYNTSRERPASMILPERGELEYRRPNRDDRPPTSTRVFDNVGKSDNGRHGHRVRDDDADRRDFPARSYIRDDRENTRYRDLPHPNRRDSHDDYVPYPEENTRHNRPRKPTLDSERLELRPHPRKSDEDRYEPHSRDYDGHFDQGGEDRSRKPRERDSHRENGRRRDYDDGDDKERRARDDYRDKREKDDDGPSKGLLAGAGAAAAAAGVASLAAEGGRRHRDKEARSGEPHSTKDTQGYLQRPERDRAEGSESTSVSGDTRSSVDRPDEDKEERRRRKRREREREEREYREAKDYDRRIREDDALSGSHADNGQARPAQDLVPFQPDPALREQKSYERRPGEAPEHGQQRPRRRRHHHRTDGYDSYSDSSSVSSNKGIGGGGGEAADPIPRQPRVVTPANDDKPAQPPPLPKSILKKARDKFPDTNTTVREGVAPLDAARRGIPEDARWTKINRRLVNPEALEQENVRFEEGPDYVIVLKVLNQEEISHYTQKTHEIREKRRLMLAAEAPPPSGPVSMPAAGQQGDGVNSEQS